MVTLENFLNKYPNDSEAEWIRRSIEKVHSHIAKRYCKLGDFYRKSGKKDTAQRYYALVISDYPNTPEAKKAEVQLSKLDKNFVVPGVGDFNVVYSNITEAPIEFEGMPWYKANGNKFYRIPEGISDEYKEKNYHIIIFKMLMHV